MHGRSLVAQPLLNRRPSNSARGLTARKEKNHARNDCDHPDHLWLLGMVSGYTLGNFIYVLLVIAIVLFLVRLISGRRV